MEKDRLVCRRQFATMRERMEDCQRAELEAGQDCLSEPMLLRGRVEASMSSRSGQKDLSIASLSEACRQAKKDPAEVMAFIERLQDVDRYPAHGFQNSYSSVAGELVALNNDIATLRRRLEHVEQDSAFKIDRLLIRVDAVEKRSTYADSGVMLESSDIASLTTRVQALELRDTASPSSRRNQSPREDSLISQSREKGTVSRRVREIEDKLQVDLNSHMRSLDLDLHKKVLLEIDTKITKELRRLDIPQIGPRIAHLEKEVSRHSVLLPCVNS